MTAQPNQPATLSNNAYQANVKSPAHMPSYRSALQGPVASLASGPGDRPDVATVAILGYN